ncbi:MAG: Daunorubicin/doxorubicin resistance ATP-binding protein DrrA [Alphaproteobacteria bacterium MarineAlpha5_Bin5]|nr:MAG: Daunorubicin/doxorubicin resistance ATP-binding protein DrrA [Alphaproteobacteria bacterium MarineAlpha5_Bin5]|tara:strand:- start:278 stop:1204 length:927 start_codon:yes stop_codon:yes gene_type:complete
MSDYKYSIEAKNVNKIFYKKSSQTNALDNFNIRIKKGSIHGLLGPNGAGKSTFINILGGLVKKNSGTVSICGLNIDSFSKQSKFKIGIVPQELNIDPFFSPNELLELQAGLYGIPKKERKTETILKNVGLHEQKNAYARTLSGGMRRRLLVAKALVHSPEMLILDEPTAGVDVELRRSLWNYIKRINDEGTTICLTTHYLEEAEELCDNITIINNGKILTDDTKQNLLNTISNKTVSFSLITKIKIPEILNKYKPILQGKKLILNYDKDIVSLKKIIDILNSNNIEFKEINTFESDLEDVFIKLIKKK